jgi:hypothetical protein
MSGHSSDIRKDTPKNWSDYIGVVSRKSDLDASLQEDGGLIVLKTSDELEICPIFQFDKDEEGKVTINSHIAAAWSLMQSLHITQLGESPFTKAGSLTKPREDYEGRSWADVLKDPETEDSTRYRIYYSIVGDAEYAAMMLSEKLTDPRYNLPQ